MSAAEIIKENEMGAAAPKERRLGNRKKLTGLLPGRLQTSDGRDVNCKPVDISPNGIGLVLNIEFDAGDHFNLVMKDKTIELEVAWVQPDFGKQDLFRYGLATIDQDIDLKKIFLEAGCLK